MDYMPGRLAVMEAWVSWTDSRYPNGIRARWRDYGFCFPPLLVNTLAELAAALIAARLVRELGGSGRQGLMAAVLLLLHPAVLLLGHGRPQWDTWLLPFFLGSTLLALRGQWAVSGFVVALGVMFKAQILFGAAVLPLLALFDRRFKEAALWLAGLVGGMAVCLAPWLIRGSLAPAKIAIVGGVGKWSSFPPPFVRNVCTLAYEHLGWNGSTRLLGFLPAESLFAIAAVTALVASAFLAHRLEGVHRFVALLMPWFGFYLLMPRVHTRYIVWPVACLSVAAVFSRVYLFCWAALAAVSTLLIIGPMVGQEGAPFPRLAAMTSAFPPTGLWVMIACSFVLLGRMMVEARASAGDVPSAPR
jgi:hypothetical protein